MDNHPLLFLKRVDEKKRCMEEVSDMISNMYDAMIDARQHYEEGFLNIKQYLFVQQFLTHKLREIDPFFKRFIYLRKGDDNNYMRVLRKQAKELLDLIGNEKYALIQALKHDRDEEFVQAAAARLEEIEEERRVLLDTIAEINILTEKT